MKPAPAGKDKVANKKKAAAPRAPARVKRGAVAAAPITAEDVLRWLESNGTRAGIAALQRYGIVAERPFGVPVGVTKAYGARIGRDHALAAALWASGRYEARLLAVFVDDPARVTGAQMDRWAADFDNWAIVDTACFHLFDRTPHVWAKVRQWARSPAEFRKRAAFALLWSLSVHDKTAPDAKFTDCLPLIEQGARDERNFVKKAVNMALRAMGKRNAALNAAAIRTAERLAQQDAAAPRWVGSHALRELKSPAVQKRLR